MAKSSRQKDINQLPNVIVDFTTAQRKETSSKGKQLSPQKHSKGKKK